jgi:hypothetical protein
MIVNSWVLRRRKTSKGVTGLERVQPSSSLPKTLEGNCSILTGTAEKLKRGCVLPRTCGEEDKSPREEKAQEGRCFLPI